MYLVVLLGGEDWSDTVLQIAFLIALIYGCWICLQMEIINDDIEILQFFKSKKEVANEVPLYFKVRVRRGGSIVFMKYQALKINYPQILISFFQRKLQIFGNNLSIKDVLPQDAQIRLNSMIQSYEDTIDGLNLLQNGHSKNNESFENGGAINKRKKEVQYDGSISVMRKFREQKLIIAQLVEEKGIEKNSSKKREKNERVPLKQQKKKLNYDDILKKRVGQNYKISYFPAYLSLSSIKRPQTKEKKQSKQKVEKREPTPVKKQNKTPPKKKQSKKPVIQPESDSDSLDITFTDSEDEQSKTKNKKKFR